MGLREFLSSLSPSKYTNTPVVYVIRASFWEFRYHIEEAEKLTLDATGRCQVEVTGNADLALLIVFRRGLYP